MLRIVLLLSLTCVLTFFVYCIVADQTASRDDPENYCKCVGYSCGCCSKINVEFLLNAKVCANISYLPDQYGISVTITYNDKIIFNETDSVKNPPPFCIVHIDKIKMEFCLRFYDLDIKNKCFSGCGELEINFYKVVPLQKFSLGCFGKNCKISPTLLTKILNTFYGTTDKNDKQDEPQPEVVLI
ncbi:uncharacterized protein LOC131669110 [Phymastichus coffea]|uniref:uncharacterized protein LOC131669110 n=1 Tax=Phymastichus coffea TaxID=108790 RepID=UPI00273B595E|nr:uncharacterized protein LOC131669110 [Phymastichus coffea]